MNMMAIRIIIINEFDSSLIKTRRVEPYLYYGTDLNTLILHSFLLFIRSLVWNKSRTSQWKIDFYDSVYKIYDKDGNLAGYLFPNYPQIREEIEDSVTLELANSHSPVAGGRRMLPMLRLDLFDIEEGQTLDEVIDKLAYNMKKAKEWQDWCISNKDKYDILAYQVHTAREDKQMLSILLNLGSQFTLGQKRLQAFLRQF